MSAPGLHPSAQADWAATLIDSLVAAGVTDAVISPGSRSTPFTAAAVAHAGLRCTAIIDERSAGFYALGLSKCTRRPTALLCTSGTAGANYYPAVIEASASYTPLLVITADRPSELQACGAPQTIDQTRLYGAFARESFHLGNPSSDAVSLRALRRKVHQAVQIALGPTPGPTHLNAPARKPLEPPPGYRDRPPAAAGSALASTVGRSRALAPDPGAIADLASRCRSARRGLIACGPAPLSGRAAAAAVDQLAEITGFPLLAEATSQLRLRPRPAGATACDGFDAFLRCETFLAAPEHAEGGPDLIIEIGSPPISAAWRDYVARAPLCCHVLLAAHGWCDPHQRITDRIVGDPAATVTDLTRALAGAAVPEPTPWRALFARADRAVWAAVEQQSGPTGTDTDVDRAPLTEARIARAVVSALPEGALLSLGNSMPVRSIDSFCPGGGRSIDVLCQRGASGIDGLISSAAGSASRYDRNGQPTALLLGDVAFAHDIGGLAIAREVTSPLVIIAVDNGGGQIFAHLPIAKSAVPDTDFNRYWLTPPRLDLRGAADCFGVAYRRPTCCDELRAVLATAVTTPGCTIVHARIGDDEKAGNGPDLWRDLWRAVDDRLKTEIEEKSS